LFGIAVLGFTISFSVPSRFAAVFMIFIARGAQVLGAGAPDSKLLFWNPFTPRVGPIVVGVFSIRSVHLILIGILVECVGAMFINVQSPPLITQRKRLSFQ
jgi:hypothetical protein